MRLPARIAGILLPCLMIAVGTAARAEPASRTIVVMDGSGSMWGQIDGRAKLEIARDAVAEVVGALPDGQEIGLIAYGHRTKGDCGDIEELVAPAPGAGPEVVAAVRAMRFVGKTPLSEAVRRAGEALRYTEASARVVLVTDGIETCGGDPCALGAALARDGLDFTAHVVGFGLTEAEGAAVACLAEATGGRYLAADDAASLGAALAEVVASPAAPAPAPAPVPPGPGVLLFAEPDFAGESYFLAADTPDFTAVLRPGGDTLNDWARSARVSGAWELCEHIHYEGDCHRIEGDVPDIGVLGLSASSLRRAGAGGEAAAPQGGALFDTDFFGADFASILYDAPGHDWPDCAQACAAESACRAWTFVRPGRSEFGECFLKDARPGPSPDPCCISGLRGDDTALLAPVAVILEAAAPAEPGLAIGWSAVPAPGQGLPPEAWALPETASGPVEAEFLPGRYAVRGEAGDTVFAAEITVRAAPGQRFVIPVSDALSPAGPDDTVPEGYICDRAPACAITDPATGLAFDLPGGWQAEPPFVYATAGGVAASAVSVSFRDRDGGRIELNPIRWAGDGPCRETSAGPLCLVGPADSAQLVAFDMIAASLDAGRPDFVPIDLGGRSPEAVISDLFGGTNQ